MTTTTIMQKMNTNNVYNPVLALNERQDKSKKYQFLSSNELGSFFEDQGFTCEGVSIANVRKEEKRGFQKHLMLFSRPDLLIDGDNRLQLLVTNSHDGSSALKINTGLYRAICANGLVSGNDIYSQTVRHIGKSIKEQLKESLYYILGNMQQLKNEVETMKKTIVSFDQSQTFMKNCVDARFKNVKNVHSVDLSSVDKLRRYEDQGQDLFRVFNRIQESIIKGGIKYSKCVPICKTLPSGEKAITGFDYKNGTTRQVTNIAKNIELNKTIWNEAMSLVA